MNEGAPLPSGTPPDRRPSASDATPNSRPPASAWCVRLANREDVENVVAAVRALLAELGATPRDPDAMEIAARALLEDGSLLVAEVEGELVGVLAASWQTAMHVPGRYALIQDLWVAPAWRGRAVGGALLQALLELSQERGVARVEVGLPRDSYAHIRATEAFYRGNGFIRLGPRMRLALQGSVP
jgi:ribosomal protein S18 acetylase RimI-like enzyme